jgi:signal transduction histidine kinase/DNA-binding response OmpR family regulator/HAMP domain-containing protein
VAREVGTEGKLGQAAAVTIEVGGVWKDLTDNVNLMAGNLTGQVRNIAEVTTAVANGDLSKKISIDVKGEFLQLKNTVNAMVDQLNAFAGEVTRVAREVGVEGKLGGQAQSKEVAGVWKDLTDNVNQLAANLTNQVRAIAEVATAVTEGDLTRQVSMEASGEVAGLKDTLNEMIRNLRETTRQNVEQDWLKTNRERFTRMLQGQDNLGTVSNMILSELATLVSVQHGVFYSMTSPTDGSEAVLQFQAGYGFEERRQLATSFRLGEGLVGQCGKEKKRILLTEVPADYVRISSGLGASAPLNIVAIPVLFEGTLCAVIELASFSAFSVTQQTFLDSITESIGIVLSTIQASALTETLLQQAQSLAEELRAQQGELRESNEGLERQATLLAERNREAANRNQEIEQSRGLLEEKAAQLAISSKYKSEFIANMSHELRTPLNSLLILAEQLKDNPDNNMTDLQVQYASVISASGKELMVLLNSILDLAKVESGTMEAELTELSLPELRRTLLNEFELVAQGKGVAYSVDIAPGTPETIVTDPQRLRQILKNLLANAFKFTEHGSVHIHVGQVGLSSNQWSDRSGAGGNTSPVIAFAVSDTGIGIDNEQQQRIFEAFAQGDGTTARLYGGTGLGLSISRELAGLLGGGISLTSTPGQGSIFTLRLPTRGVHNPSALLPSTTDPVLELPAPNQFREEPRLAASQFLDNRRQTDDMVEDEISGKKILVVDDDFRNIFALTALLERGNARVIAAESGTEALAILERESDIDIVLMDIMMPIMDGYETMRAIRALEGFKTVPMIAVTGKVMAGERERCIDAGANDYVPKPIDSPILLAAIRPWLVLSEARVPSPADADPGGEPTATPDDRVEGPQILVVDGDFRNTFALKALLERGDRVIVAESGDEALDVLERTRDVDVVLMDVTMPLIDGYDTLRAIRVLEHCRALPIIAVTGAVVTGERERCIEAGANDYVPKPRDSAELFAALRPWLPTPAQQTAA